MKALTALSSIATPFRYWQETQGYLDILKMCDAVVRQDTKPLEDATLGTVPGVVQNYAAYFVRKFRDSSSYPTSHSRLENSS